MNKKLHTVTDASGRPIRSFMTDGQVTDYSGTWALLSSLAAADWMIAVRRFDADLFRNIVKNRGIRACIPGRKSSN